MRDQNRKVILNKAIAGVPEADDFRLIATAMPEPGDGEILVRHIYLSLDPYQRPAIAGIHISSAGPLADNQAPGGETIGQVIKSRHGAFNEGDFVRHSGGWQEYSVANGAQAFKVDPALAPLPSYLGVLGMPGLTAYASMIKLAGITAGQNVLVSAAAGPVGSMVGQIAMQEGAIAYGVAGSAEKCRFVKNELGFADCINYKQADYPDTLRQAIPAGVDVYHDNVGGPLLTDALGVLNNYGTVILCGLMSQYNSSTKGAGFNLAPVILKRAIMKGLIVMDFEDQRPAFFDRYAPAVRDGRIRYREDRVTGIENTGAHFARLMRGENFGKALVVLAPEA